MRKSSTIFSAGGWFLRSGIQTPDGGVARYYRTDLAKFAPVSTEITGYTVSTLLYLHGITGESEYFERALAAAYFLTRRAWDGAALPFELDSGPEGRLSYFFDCGIAVRGILSAWDATGDPELLRAAVTMGRTMAVDFDGRNGEFHPVLQLPEKRPMEYDAQRWSRTPGCYQLKAATAWWRLFEATGDHSFCTFYERAVAGALRTYNTFLPAHPDLPKAVDRLHAFLYFLEGLLPRAQQRNCAAVLCWGIDRAAQQIEAAASEFERCDAYAQLLRLRISAHQLGVVPLDPPAAQHEATVLAGFQSSGPDPRMDGGFYFGRRAGAWLPYLNPVSTAFAVQALLLWDRHLSGAPAFPLHWLI